MSTKALFLTLALPLHGDLKDDNICVVEQDGKVNVSLIDFGCSSKANQIWIDWDWDAIQPVLDNLGGHDAMDVDAIQPVLRDLDGHEPMDWE